MCDEDVMKMQDNFFNIFVCTRESVQQPAQGQPRHAFQGTTKILHIYGSCYTQMSVVLEGCAKVSRGEEAPEI